MSTHAKDGVDHIEVASPPDSSDSDGVFGFETSAESLPKGYFYSKFFLGSMLATGLGLWCGVSAFVSTSLYTTRPLISPCLISLKGYAAPILGQINQDLGPDSRYTWISLVYNAVLAVCLGPIGRLSDIFGRRYFFIGGGIIGVVGSIMCATATSIPIMIGGNVLLAIASATQLCFHFVMG
jgi:MFS family permease